MLMRKICTCFNTNCKYMKENRCYNKYLINECKHRKRTFKNKVTLKNKVM